MFNNTFSIAARIMMQLARDRRTIALLVIAPLLIASLVGVSVPDKQVLDFTAPAMMAMLILFFGFLLTGISFQRERSQGTLERLMATPVSRLDIVAGYLMGFLLFALLQTLIIFFWMVYVLKIDYQGQLWEIIIFQALIGIGAVCLGTFASTFAKNEFQIMQFIPLIIIPQFFICGLLWPVDTLPNYLQWIAKFLPLTYGIEGIRGMMLQGDSLGGVFKDVWVLIAFAIGFLILASLSLRRGSST